MLMANQIPPTASMILTGCLLLTAVDTGDSEHLQNPSGDAGLRVKTPPAASIAY